MAGRTISSTITIGVTLGSGAYPSPLTITGAGQIAPTVSGAAALIGTSSGGLYLDNQGILAGASGAGAGAILTGVTATNEGRIAGGSGGSVGGTGVSLGNAAVLTNTGTIIAGSAVPGAFYGGGTGVSVASGATLLNAGTIIAGNGNTGTRPGYDGFFGGPGGDGVYLHGGTVVDTGTITGGNGATGGNAAGDGGVGAFVSTGVLINAGTIAGGIPASSNPAYAVEVINGTLIVDPGAVFNGLVGVVNSGDGTLVFAATTLATTLGGFGSEYLNFQQVAVGAGPGWTIAGTVAQGFLLDLGAGATLSNESTIGGVVLAAGATLHNAGTIASGLGAGVALVGPSLTVNQSLIEGASGSDFATSGSGAPNASVGATLASGATLVNGGTILGGTGGRYYPSGIGVPGAAGIALGAGATFTNAGTVMGGAVSATRPGATGGTGVILSADDAFANTGSIVGGRGGGTGADDSAANPADSFSNGGTITGGVGRSAGVYSAGGVGVILAVGSLDNSGAIRGGYGAQGSTTQPGTSGGIGVALDSGRLINEADGSVVGGVGGGIGTGTYAGTGAVGIMIAAGTLDNFGTIAGGSGGFGNIVIASGKTATSGGAGGAGVVLTAGTLVNDGSITGGLGGYAAGGNSVGTDASGVTVAAAGTLINNGSITGGGEFGSNGAAGVVLDGGMVIDSGVIAGGVGIVNKRQVQGAAVAFGSGSGTLELLPGAVLKGTIDGFSGGALIDVGSFVAQSSFYLNGTLTLESAGGATVTLDLPGHSGIADFMVGPDGAGGTDVSAIACFVAGTRLATPDGEVAVEHLKIGDPVMTASGRTRQVRWIGHRCYDGRFIAGNRDAWPVLIRAGALANGIPSRDLRVSPKHAMFLDDVLVAAEHLVNGRSVVQLRSVASVSYFHVELDDHDILLAEGAPAESFIDHDSRLMFHNAAAFHLLYPAAVPMTDCAPRVEDGEVLERVRLRLAARAGLAADHVDDAAQDGPMDGRIDILDGYEVSGWAFDLTRPRTPVWLEILDGDRVIGSIVANRFRPDLMQAGLGDGRCAYVFQFEAPPACVRKINVRRASDERQVFFFEKKNQKTF